MAKDKSIKIKIKGDATELKKTIGELKEEIKKINDATEIAEKKINELKNKQGTSGGGPLNLSPDFEGDTILDKSPGTSGGGPLNLSPDFRGGTILDKRPGTSGGGPKGGGPLSEDPDYRIFGSSFIRRNTTGGGKIDLSSPGAEAEMRSGESRTSGGGQFLDESSGFVQLKETVLGIGVRVAEEIINKNIEFKKQIEQSFKEIGQANIQQGPTETVKIKKLREDTTRTTASSDSTKKSASRDLSMRDVKNTNIIYGRGSYPY